MQLRFLKRNIGRFWSSLQIGGVVDLEVEILQRVPQSCAVLLQLHTQLEVSAPRQSVDAIQTQPVVVYVQPSEFVLLQNQARVREFLNQNARAQRN